MRVLTLAIGVLFIASGHAFGQSDPGSFLKIIVSSQKCKNQPTDPQVDRFRIFIKNDNQDKRIGANVRMDTIPSGQTFPMYDNQLGDYIEEFPRFYEHRLAPGERERVGCTRIFRPSRNGMNITPIRTEYEVAGALFIDPSEPKPPEENAKHFIAFMEKKLPNRNSCMSTNPGFYFISNLHSYRQINARVQMIDDEGRSSGVSVVNLAPQENIRISCTKADSVNSTVDHVNSAEFTTPR